MKRIFIIIKRLGNYYIIKAGEFFLKIFESWRISEFRVKSRRMEISRRR